MNRFIIVVHCTDDCTYSYEAIFPATATSKKTLRAALEMAADDSQIGWQDLVCGVPGLVKDYHLSDLSAVSILTLDEWFESGT